MPECWDSDPVIEQFNRLTAIVDKLMEREETRGYADGAIFWDGYNAAIHDIRYCGLTLLADHLEQRYNTDGEADPWAVAWAVWAVCSARLSARFL
jgi:hypothetical protein